MKLLQIAAIVWLLGFAEICTAQNTGTVDQYLTGLVSIIASKCQKNRGALSKDYEAQGKAAEARSVMLMEASLCDCMPAQAQKLRASLNSSQLRQQVTEAEFQRRYSPRLMNKCAGDQLRATYGDGCSGAFAKFRKNAPAYCRCMHNSLFQLSDEEVVHISKESAEYTPRAANAKARGMPMPEQPPGVKRMAEMDAACTTK